MTTIREKKRPGAQRLVKARPARAVEAPYEMTILGTHGIPACR